MAAPVDHKDKKLLIVLIFAGILSFGLIVFAVMTYAGSPGPGKSSSATTGIPVNPVSTQPLDFVTTSSANTAVPVLIATTIPAGTPARTVTAEHNPTVSPVTSAQPIVTVLPVMFTSGDSSGPVAPEPFFLSVSPASASGKPGETISYTLRIEGGERQTEPIHFALTASALIFSQTYDIGDEQPPFPKTSVYQFIVPGNIPPGITINGVITATGAGQTRVQPVTLKVL
ncbi:MAG: hypothetical protein NTV68_06455 [Methanomicrobiales archaeon]|nr:hypothetical protein [Methanomicrobiales archaeon]